MNTLAPKLVPVSAPDPTLAGFTNWVTLVMGVPESVLPVDSPYLQLAYDEALNLTYTGLQQVPNLAARPVYPAHPIAPTPPARVGAPSIYAIAVYNLGGHILVTIAMDDPEAQPPPPNAPTFWADLRNSLNMNVLSYGFVSSASDQGTSASQQIPNQIADMTLMGLDLLKTPWGRRYMQIVGQWGTLWGIS
jgi:hypothetical protein